MVRDLKMLWLAGVCALSLSALPAPAAQAAPEFTASAYPATITGSNFAGSETLTAEGGTVQCDSHFASNSFNAPTSTLTITPGYSNCVAFGFINASYKTEGCTYVLHVTERVSKGVYKHHMDISCPAGKSIKIEAGTCKAEIKGQTGLTTTKTTNSGNNITLQWELSGISLVVTTDGFGCPFSGTGTKSATQHGDLLLSRTGGGSISISGDFPSLIGTVASSYPATLTGSNTQGSEAFTTEAGAVRCNSHFVSASFGAETETLTLTPTFSDCTQAFGFASGVVNMEGCTYVLKATEKVEADVYKHHLDISCPEGKSIKVEGGTCKAEIKEQSDLTTVMTTNLAAGTLTMQPNLSSIAMTVTTDGFGCPFSSTGAKTVAYHGDAVLSRVGGGTVHVTGP
jgi:hypothetical protein